MSNLNFKNEDEIDILINAMKTDDDGIYQDYEHLKYLLFNTKLDNLNEVIESVFAIDIALAIDDFSNDEILEFFDIIDDEHTAQILEQSTERLQGRIIDLLPDENILNIFKFMSYDDITDIVGNANTHSRKQLLNLMRGADNMHVQKLLEYKDDSAGGIMTTEYICLKHTLSVANALIKIKEIGPKTEIIETIFVIDENKTLVGTADLRDIFTASDDATLFDIMHDNIITVSPHMDQEQVSQLVSKYDLKAIAVVNRRGSLLGIITVDDIIDVLVEEQTEDILKLGGVSGDDGIHSSIFESVKVRLPWLLVNLVTASFAAFIVSKFEATITQVVALSAIMPIIAATSGNAGSQTLAIIIRGITLGQINLEEDSSRVFKEMLVSMLNSCITGSIASLVVYVMYGNIYLSGIVMMAMFLNSIVSSSFGFFIPLTLKSLKLDPALASGIFLTAATDIMAFFIFLALANNFINFLI